MQIKAGVIRTGLSIEMRAAEKLAEGIWKREGKVIDLGGELDLAAQGVTVTSALDGVHSAGSLHPCGYAEDFRTRYFSPERLQIVAMELRRSLEAISNFYQVVVEKDHIHVEYDRGTRDIK